MPDGCQDPRLDIAEKRKEQRRRQILDAAFDCCVRFGYSKVAINDIAARAGLSRPLIEATNTLFPRLGSKYRAPIIEMMGRLIGDEAAELLILAVKGLYYDRPPVELLRRRIGLLVDRFVD